MNWTAIIIIAVLLIALLAFLVWKNFRDEKEFEQQINQDYHKSKDAEQEADGDAITH